MQFPSSRWGDNSSATTPLALAVDGFEVRLASFSISTVGQKGANQLADDRAGAKGSRNGNPKTDLICRWRHKGRVTHAKGSYYALNGVTHKPLAAPSLVRAVRALHSQALKV